MSEILTLKKNKNNKNKNNKEKDAKINEVKINEVVDKPNKEKEQEVKQDIQEGRFYLFTSKGLLNFKATAEKNNNYGDSDDFYDEYRMLVDYNKETHLNKLHRESYYQYVIHNRSCKKTEFQDIQNNNYGKKYLIQYLTDKNKHTKINPDFSNHIILYGSDNHMGSIEDLVKNWFTLDDIKEFLDNMVDNHSEVLNHPNHFLSEKEADRIKQYKQNIDTLYSKLYILLECDDEKNILKQFCDDAINGRDVKGKLADILPFLGEERVKRALECLQDCLKCIIEKEQTLDEDEYRKKMTLDRNKDRQETIKLLDQIKNYDKKNIDDALKNKTQELQSC